VPFRSERLAVNNHKWIEVPRIWIRRRRGLSPEALISYVAVSTLVVVVFILLRISLRVILRGGGGKGQRDDDHVCEPKSGEGNE